MDFTDMISIMGSNEDCMQLKKESGKFRMSLCSYDKSLLENKNLRLNIEELSNAPDGRFVIPYKGTDQQHLKTTLQNEKKSI